MPDGIDGVFHHDFQWQLDKCNWILSDQFHVIGSSEGYNTRQHYWTFFCNQHTRSFRNSFQNSTSFHFQFIDDMLWIERHNSRTDSTDDVNPSIPFVSTDSSMGRLPFPRHPHPGPCWQWNQQQSDWVGEGILNIDLHVALFSRGISDDANGQSSASSIPRYSLRQVDWALQPASPPTSGGCNLLNTNGSRFWD